MPSWDSTQYLQFANERTQPSIDLAARVTLPAARIVDLGCGPGNSTAVLAAVTPHYPRQIDGRLLMPFRRLFVIAYR